MRIFVLLLLLLIPVNQIHAHSHAKPEDDIPLTDESITNQNSATTNTDQQTFDQHITTEDGKLLVYYPQGWVGKHHTPDTIILTNFANIFDRSGLMIPDSGEVFVQVGYVKRSRILQPDGTVNLHNILSPISDSLTNAEGGHIFSQPEALRIGDFSASHTLAALEVGSGNTDVYLLAVDRPDRHMVVLITAMTSAGEMPDHLPVIHDIARSVELHTMDTPRVVADDVLELHDFTFKIPSGWYGQVTDASNLTIASSSDLLDIQTYGELEGADMIYHVTLTRRSEIMPENGSLADLAYAILETFGDDIKDGIRLDISVDGHPATGIAFTANEKSNPMNLYYLFIDYENWDRIMVVVGITRGYDMEGLVSNALSIVQQVVITESYETEAFDFRQVSVP